MKCVCLTYFVEKGWSKDMTTEREEGKPTRNERDKKSKKEEDRQLTEELEESFPASDPPAATQPGSGITGSVPPSK
jgi:hypothetical protein